MTRTKTPTYEIRFLYTRGGSGVGVAVFRYEAWSWSAQSVPAALTFMRDDGLFVADGFPRGNLDGGHYAEDWHSVRTLMYDDSPEDGTYADWLESEYPGLLKQVERVFRTGRSQRLQLVGSVSSAFPLGGDRKLIRDPERKELESDAAYAARLVRAFLGFRGTDHVGHRVNVHRRDGVYGATINYETVAWTKEFMDYHEELSERGWDVPDVEPLSSYEVGVLGE